MATENQSDSGNDFPEASDNASFNSETDSFNAGSEKYQPISTTKKDQEKYGHSHTHPEIIVNVAGNNYDRVIAEAQKANIYTKRGHLWSFKYFLLSGKKSIKCNG